MPEYNEYCVQAGIQFDEDSFWEIETEWMMNRETAIKIMERLRDDGHTAEVHTRTLNAAVNPEEVPE